MALVENMSGRTRGGGYERLFGDAEVGHLISRVQAAVISAGSELEKIITTRVPEIADLDEFLRRGELDTDVKIANKRQVKKSTRLNAGGSEPDFLIFRRHEGRTTCHVVELKDGDAFDTKKSAAEFEAMESFVQRNGRNIPFTVDLHFCCFNQDDRGEIVSGFKGRIPPESALTGREFCALLQISYDEIIRHRAADARDNLEYFVSELSRIPSVAQLMQATRWIGD